METLTPEEGLVLTRLIEEPKQYPRPRLALLEALQLTALLEMPAQLDELKKSLSRWYNVKMNRDEPCNHTVRYCMNTASDSIASRRA